MRLIALLWRDYTKIIWLYDLQVIMHFDEKKVLPRTRFRSICCRMNRINKNNSLDYEFISKHTKQLLLLFIHLFYHTNSYEKIPKTSFLQTTVDSEHISDCNHVQTYKAKSFALSHNIQNTYKYTSLNQVCREKTIMLDSFSLCHKN